MTSRHLDFADWFRTMRKARWLLDSGDPVTKPAIYHCISRVVDRRFVFGDEERETFRMFMRMYENFSGGRVRSYPVVQPEAFAQGDAVGGAHQERDRGKRSRGADDGDIYRSQSGAGGDGFRSWDKPHGDGMSFRQALAVHPKSGVALSLATAGFLLSDAGDSSISTTA